jgi:hypothetical protein
MQLDLRPPGNFSRLIDVDLPDVAPADFTGHTSPGG